MLSRALVSRDKDNHLFDLQLTASDELQARCAGYVEAEIERYAEQIAENAAEQEDEEEEEVEDNSDSGSETETEETNKSRSQSQRSKKGKGKKAAKGKKGKKAAPKKQEKRKRKTAVQVRGMFPFLTSSFSQTPTDAFLPPHQPRTSSSRSVSSPLSASSGPSRPSSAPSIPAPSSFVTQSCCSSTGDVSASHLTSRRSSSCTTSEMRATTVRVERWSLRWSSRLCKECVFFLFSPSFESSSFVFPQACDLYLDAPDDANITDEHLVSLGRNLIYAVVVRGAQLAVVSKLPTEDHLRLHLDACKYAVKKLAKFEEDKRRDERNKLLSFFKALAHLLLGLDGRAALKVKTSLDALLDESSIEVSPASKVWEPLRAYQRRLINTMSKDPCSFLFLLPLSKAILTSRSPAQPSRRPLATKAPRRRLRRRPSRPSRRRTSRMMTKTRTTKSTRLRTMTSRSNPRPALLRLRSRRALAVATRCPSRKSWVSNLRDRQGGRSALSRRARLRMRSRRRWRRVARRRRARRGRSSVSRTRFVCLPCSSLLYRLLTHS